MLASNLVGPDASAAPYSSGIKVIIIGLGICGLSAALECYKRGHTVIAFEKASTLEPVGDFIGLASNSGRVIGRWSDGAVSETLKPWLNTSTVVNINDYEGKLILKQDMTDMTKDPAYLITRWKFLNVLYHHAVDLGIDVRLGTSVSDFWEDEQHAGVTLNGERIKADCVFCCDGVHSKTREYVSGQKLSIQSTGKATFRALIDGRAVAQDPDARWILEGAESSDRFEIIFAQNAQMSIQSSNQGKEIAWVCLHTDNREIPSSWSSPADPEEMFDLIKNWALRNQIEAVIRHTPRHKFINYPLVDTEPLDKWVSKHRRMILLGDAAHTFSPATGQGASQGIEDAAVAAICLQLAGKENVQLGLQVAEQIRYPRATRIQLRSSQANTTWRSNNWDDPEENQEERARLPVAPWIYQHDCQKYCFEEFDNVIEAIRKGVPPIPHNLGDPDGKVFFPIHTLAPKY